jgi:hypothetical protein
MGTGSYTCAPCNFATTDSGTTLIAIKGAIASDHGTSTGWSSSFGVDVTPATFTTTANNAYAAIWSFTSDYWTVNSQVRTGLESGYGFVVNNAWPHAVAIPIAVSWVGTPTTNITLQYVDVEGAGLDINNGETTTVTSVSCTGGTTANATVTTNSVSWHVPYIGKYITVSGVTGGSGYNVTAVAISGVTDQTHFSYPASCSGSGTGGTVTGPFTQGEEDVRDIGGSSTLFEHSYVHNSSEDAFLIVSSASTSITVQYSEINGNSSNSTLHGEGFSTQQANGLVFAYNVLKNYEGTSAIDVLCASGCPLTSNNWQVYGNVFVYSNGNPNNRNGVGDGIVFCQQTCTNFQIYNNSIVNLQATYGNTNANLFGWQSLGNGSSCSGITIENNLLYQSATANPIPGTSSCTSFTEDYNTFSSTVAPSSLSPNDVRGISTNFFTDWVNNDFHLSSDTTLWLPLGTPFNLDPDGITHTSSRGAYQFGSPQPPAPPQGLTALVQ